MNRGSLAGTNRIRYVLDLPSLYREILYLLAVHHNVFGWLVLSNHVALAVKASNHATVKRFVELNANVSAGHEWLRSVKTIGAAVQGERSKDQEYILQHDDLPFSLQRCRFARVMTTQ
jgi:hypothetical protein